MKFRFFLCFVVMLFLREPALLCQERVVKDPSQGAITVQEYCTFLNAVAAKDPYYLYEGIGSNQIIRFGEPGNYHYEIPSSQPKTPMLLVSKLNAEQYCDWLKNTASTSTINFNSYEVAQVDSFLKSNLLIFHLVKTEACAYQAGIAEIAAAGGTDEELKEAACALAWIVSMVEGGKGRSEVQDHHFDSRNLHERAAILAEPPTMRQGIPDERIIDSFPKKRRVAQVLTPIKGVQNQAVLVEEILKMIEEKVSVLEVARAMICFRTCDFIGSSEEMAALWGGANQRGSDITTRYLILNESNTQLILPATGSQERVITIVPPIIPMGVTIRIGTKTYTSPSRVPEAQENRAIRALRRKSFEFYYGYKKAQKLLSQFDGIEKQDDPVTVGEMSNIFVKMYTTDPTSQKTCELLPLEKSQKIENSFRKNSKIRKMAHDASRYITHFRSSQIEFQKQQEIASKTSDALINPKKYLLEGLYYATASTACRTAHGSVDGMKRGIEIGLMLGAISASVIIFHTAYVTDRLFFHQLMLLCCAITCIPFEYLIPEAATLPFAKIRATSPFLLLESGTITFLARDSSRFLILLTHKNLHLAIFSAVTVLAYPAHGAGIGTVAGAALGGILGATRSILDLTKDFAQGVVSDNRWEDHLVKTPAQKAREAFSYWSGIRPRETLELMKNAQETDRQLINTTDDFLESSAAVEELFLEQPTSGTELENRPKIKFNEMKKILSHYINGRIAERQELIDDLQAKITEKK